MPTYVYGITTEHEPPSTERGIGGSGVRTLTEDGMSAIVGTVADGPVEANRANLMAHTDVLQEALRAGTVVPMRFGIVMGDDADVRQDLLRARRDDLDGLLEAMKGQVELSLSVYYIEEAVLADIVATTPAVARLQASVRSLPEDASYYQRIRLGELVAEALNRRRAADAASLIERLEPLAAAVRQAADLPERTVVRASFLVPRNEVERFRDAVDAAARESADHMVFKLIGPLPPFSFVDIAVNGEADA